MELALLWAAAPNGLIGRDNWMPWRLPNDLKRFKALTVGGCVVMGHTTFRCLGRPLPNRDNLVMRRDKTQALDGVTTVDSLNCAIEVARAKGHSRLWVVGGAQIYRLALPMAQRLEMTLVHDPSPLQPGDTCFEFRPNQAWRLEQARYHPQDAGHSHAFSFLRYRKIS